MLINYPYKFRLEPTPEQKKKLYHFAFTCRFVYNLALDQRNLAKSPDPLPSLLEIWQKRLADKEAGVKREREEIDYEAENKKEIVHKGINFHFQSAQMTMLRKNVEWMGDVPFSCLQQTLMSLQSAFKNFFDRVKKGQRVSEGRNPFGFPVYRNRYRLSIPFKPIDVSIKKVCERAGGEDGVYFSEVNIPLIGLVKFRQNRPVIGKTKTPTIKLEGDKHWYVVILTEQEIDDPEPAQGEIGIDLVVAKMITLSDGTHYPLTEKQVTTLKNIENLNDRMKRLQARCDHRKNKFSNNWIKEKRKIAKMKHRQMKSRNELHHEISHAITEKYGRIAVEDLNIKGMTASAAGSVEEPGKMVKQKSGLNRVILEKGWGKFVNQLEYKSAWKGGEVVKVDPKNTSRMCSECGHIAAESRTTQEKFKCVQCGHQENADVNASKNILSRMNEV